MRKLLVAFGALAAGVLAPTFSNISWASPTTAAVFSGQTSISAAPRSDPAATAQMKAALRHGVAKSSLHYVPPEHRHDRRIRILRCLQPGNPLIQIVGGALQ